ncbi:hypothetical protein [Iningainema tapete]|uniref:Limonene hydroxylase n=1 Tax=Iningainema tapete BLCC-T55 TaxID=2748662 RepID=A0A8J7C884_9CYAN|nr:hypothetical protein [Iningainema tapete]MBD2774256.1 hypothetical protein [Iningainema tapete BLCC-T55]
MHNFQFPKIFSIVPPWGDRIAILDHLEAHIQPGAIGLSEGGQTLPDKDKVLLKTGLRWMPGGADGAWVHHGSAGEARDIAQQVLEVLLALTQQVTCERAGNLYTVLMEHSAIDYIDPLLEAVWQQQLDTDGLYEIARWLATRAPDRELVKLGISLLGLFANKQDRELLMTLGRYEEFTLYVVVALLCMEDNAEISLWELAQHVTGWGRIQIIERLCQTRNPQIQGWMLRFGYRNDVMYEYTACICATTGNLLLALEQPDPDDALLEGAGEILSTLIEGRGGPAEDVQDYPDAAAVTKRYLQLLCDRDITLEQFVVVQTIREFLNEEDGVVHDSTLGWSFHRTVMLEFIEVILSRSNWHEQVNAALASPDARTFATATQAAKALGMDIWEVYFERLQQGEPHWYFVMQTNDSERVERVIALALQRLPLEQIASGPTDDLGLDPEFAHHRELDFILQDLHRFPGKGWSLISAGLQSPVTRNRNMAIRVLANWERQSWPEEAENLLARALSREPNQDTREYMQEVLAGESLNF